MYIRSDKIYFIEYKLQSTFFNEDGKMQIGENNLKYKIVGKQFLNLLYNTLNDSNTYEFICKGNAIYITKINLPNGASSWERFKFKELKR